MGMRVDNDGNLWPSAADGVHCIAPDGKLMGKILVPEKVSNICFGGRDRHRLFITASTSAYTIQAGSPPLRNITTLSTCLISACYPDRYFTGQFLRI